MIPENFDWSKVSDNVQVIELLKQREKIEDSIRLIDENSLILFELEMFLNWKC